MNVEARLSSSVGTLGPFDQGDTRAAQGQGVGNFSPSLADQSAAYVVEQLDAWKAGDSRDPSGAFMQAESSHLPDPDIAAVAAFLESLEDAKEVQP
jgi:cytochrome c553